LILAAVLIKLYCVSAHRMSGYYEEEAYKSWR
jgi:hypothetical protein